MKTKGIIISFLLGLPILGACQKDPKQNSDSLRRIQIETIKNDPAFKNYINRVNDYIQSNSNDEWHLSDPKVMAKQTTIYLSSYCIFYIHLNSLKHICFDVKVY